MSTVLNPLSRKAAQLSANGLSDLEIKDSLCLSVSTWELWRSDPEWVALRDSLKAENATGQEKEADKSSEDALETEVSQQFAR